MRSGPRCSSPPRRPACRRATTARRARDGEAHVPAEIGDRHLTGGLARDQLPVGRERGRAAFALQRARRARANAGDGVLDPLCDRSRARGTGSAVASRRPRTRAARAEIGARAPADHDAAQRPSVRRDHQPPRPRPVAPEGECPARGRRRQRDVGIRAVRHVARRATRGERVDLAGFAVARSLAKTMGEAGSARSLAEPVTAVAAATRPASAVASSSRR